jgi:hypothetical protein
LLTVLQVRKSRQAQNVQTIQQSNQHFSSQDATPPPVAQNDEMAKRGINESNIKSITQAPIPKRSIVITSARPDPKNIGTTAGGQVSFANKTGEQIELTEEKNLLPAQSIKANETITYTMKTSGIYSFKIGSTGNLVHVIVASN